MTPSDTATTSTGRQYTSEGHRRLCELTHSSAEIAAKLGVTRQAPSAWRKRGTRPAPALAAALEQHFGIPARSWSQRPAGAPRPAPQRDDDATGGTVLEELEELLATVREARCEPGLLPADLVRLAAEERQCLATIAKVERDEAESAERIRGRVLEVSRPLVARIARSLDSYPEAREKVLEAVRGWATESGVTL